MLSQDLINSSFDFLVNSGLPIVISNEIINRSLLDYNQLDKDNIASFIQLVHFRLELFQSSQRRLEEKQKIKNMVRNRNISNPIIEYKT